MARGLPHLSDCIHLFIFGCKRLPRTGHKRTSVVCAVQAVPVFVLSCLLNSIKSLFCLCSAEQHSRDKHGGSLRWSCSVNIPEETNDLQ